MLTLRLFIGEWEVILQFGFYKFYSVVWKLYVKGEGFDSETPNQNGDEDVPDGEPSSDEEPQRHCGTTIAKLLSGNMLQSTRDVDQACDLWGSVCVIVENIK